MAHHVHRAAEMGAWVLNCGNWYNADRVADDNALIAILQEILTTRPGAEWLAALGEAGIPSEPVLSHDEALAHPQGQARGLVSTFADLERGPIQHLASSLRLEATPARIARRAPDLGEQNAEIRAWLAQKA